MNKLFPQFSNILKFNGFPPSHCFSTSTTPLNVLC